MALIIDDVVQTKADPKKQKAVEDWFNSVLKKRNPKVHIFMGKWHKDDWIAKLFKNKNV